MGNKKHKTNKIRKNQWGREIRPPASLVHVTAVQCKVCTHAQLKRVIFHIASKMHAELTGDILLTPLLMIAVEFK